MNQPTPRQLDALAAWWQTGGSNIAAADLMGITPQVVRNMLMQFRRQEGTETNLLLARRYLALIERRSVMLRRNVA